MSSISSTPTSASDTEEVVDEEARAEIDRMASQVIELMENQDLDDQRPPTPESGTEKVVEIVTALSPFTATGNSQLTFDEGDEIRIVQKTSNEWWWGEIDGQFGYVPVNHVASKSDVKSQRLRWQDDEYFESYSKLKIHREMLSDDARTLAYKSAIEKNPDVFKDKVVLDVGCGTGILSMFAAKYGLARKVYGVEASGVAAQARKVIRHNKLDRFIEVIEGQIEGIEIPEKVDIIISEWMGTLLLFELMIESVLHAREKFLKPDGLMWPSTAQLFLVPCSAHQILDERVNFWSDLYGFDFSPLQRVAYEESFERPIFHHIVDKDDCLGPSVVCTSLDMKEMSVSYLEDIDENISFNIEKDGDFSGIASWFQVEFGGSSEVTEVVQLNTGPDHKLTHWKQDLFVLDKIHQVSAGDKVKGRLRIMRHQQWRRHLRVIITYHIINKDGETSEDFSKTFRLWR